MKLAPSVDSADARLISDAKPMLLRETTSPPERARYSSWRAGELSESDIGPDAEIGNRP